MSFQKVFESSNSESSSLHLQESMNSTICANKRCNNLPFDDFVTKQKYTKFTKQKEEIKKVSCSTLNISKLQSSSVWKAI